MINNELYSILSEELGAAKTSTNPELVERLNLACILLNKEFVTAKAVDDYFEWVEKTGNMPSAALQLFSKYIFTRRTGRDDRGIYPFLVSLFDTLSEIMQSGKYPGLRNPQDRIDEIKALLSSQEVQVDATESKLSELSQKISELNERRSKAKSAQQQYSSQFDDFMKLKQRVEKLEADVQQFLSENGVSEQSDMVKLNEDLNKRMEEIRNLFTLNEGFTNYFATLGSIVEEYNAIEIVSRFNRLKAEIAEDCSVADEIISEVITDTGKLESAEKKMLPLFEEFQRELKLVVERIQKAYA